MISIKNVDWLNLIPQSLARDPNIVAAIKVFVKQIDKITVRLEDVLILNNIKNLPNEILDQLAIDFKIDWYSTDFDLETKRRVVESALEVHRKKGTPYAIETAIKNIYGNCLLEEWFDYTGTPYSFRVKTTLYEEENATEQHKKALRLIYKLKNTRSWLDSFAVYYPDILMPIKITNIVECISCIEAKHTFWNLAEWSKGVFWDGEYCLDGTADLSGFFYFGNYGLVQRHKAIAQINVVAKQNSTGVEKSILNGSFLLDGSHDLSGTCNEIGQIENRCSVIRIDAQGHEIEGSFEGL